MGEAAYHWSTGAWESPLAERLLRWFPADMLELPPRLPARSGVSCSFCSSACRACLLAAEKLPDLPYP